MVRMNEADRKYSLVHFEDTYHCVGTLSCYHMSHVAHGRSVVMEKQFLAHLFVHSNQMPVSP